MQKIGYDLLQKITQEPLTSNELNLLIYICHFQDEYGTVKGVFYKEVCEELDISYQGFYDALNGLKRKEIVSFDRKQNDYDIIIIGNNAIATDNFKKGYISLNRPIFEDKNFLGLKAGAKLFALHLIRHAGIQKKETDYKESSQSMQRLKKKFLKKWSDTFNVSERTIKSYMKALDPFMTIYLEDGRKYYITLKAGVKNRNLQSFETITLRKHQVRCAFRRNRIKNTNKEEALLRKLSVFSEYILKCVNFDFASIIHKSLQEINKTVKNCYKWKRIINLDVIEKIMVKELGVE